MRMIRLMLLTLLLVAFSTLQCWGEASQVVTFGADLNEGQRVTLLGVFGLNANSAANIRQLVITNQEERHYLKGLVPDQVIGSKAISSVFVELLPAGQGINAQVHNITWVTPAMYSNALVTAGVKDARVIAAAPFQVSGTAALTGIFKAFEAASGTKLSEERKQAANEELVRTGELGQQLQNKDKAAQLIMLIKERVLQEKLNDPEKIRTVVINVAAQLNINLTPEQINSIVDLMVRLSKTNININDLRTQLAGIEQKLNTILAKQKEATGLLESIWTALVNFVNQVMAQIRKFLG
ncbi:MAG TPA: DUF1002 domain-containing protein [Bacillota bacterium]|nr:DUF1002 domain-containing protein [Bacillota bacterium]